MYFFRFKKMIFIWPDQGQNIYLTNALRALKMEINDIPCFVDVANTTGWFCWLLQYWSSCRQSYPTASKHATIQLINIFRLLKISPLITNTTSPFLHGAKNHHMCLKKLCFLVLCFSQWLAAVLTMRVKGFFQHFQNCLFS